MTIKEKILTFLDSRGVRKAEFFESIGVAPSNFKGAAKQTELGGGKIVRILIAFPDLSAEWLLRDEGPMLRTMKEQSQVPSSQDTTSATESPAEISPLIDKFITTIQTQSEEIGRLKARIEELEMEESVQTLPKYLRSTSKETVET